MKFQKNEILPIFLQWQDEEDYLGEAKLLEYIKEGLSYTEEYSMFTVQYSCEYWRVMFTTSEVYQEGFEKIVPIKKVIGVLKLGQPLKDVNDKELALQKEYVPEVFNAIENLDTSFWDSRVDGTEVSGSLF